MPNLGPATPEIHGIIAQVIRDWHPSLSDCEARIGALLAYPTEAQSKAATKTGVAPVLLKEYKQPKDALTKINGKAAKLEGSPDATIWLDALAWAEKTDAEKVALIDRHITELATALDKDGILKSDDSGRPIMKKRLPDYHLTGFREVASRHPETCPDVVAYRDIFEVYGQTMMGFMAGVEDAASV